MKVVTYVVGNGKPRVGMLENSSVVDIGFDGDMVAFIEAGAPIGKQTHVENARLLAPLRPRSVRDFLTFEGHMHNALTRLGRLIPQEWYTVPAYYKGMPDTVIGPDEEIPWPAYTNRLDHELELAAIIGRKGKDISKADAPGYVFGYTIWNDMSARDVQTLDASNARMIVRVNSEVWGEDTSAHMHHTFADLISYASQAQTLYPGDVFGSGTAAGGSGLELDRPLKEGDIVEMEIEGIGILRNRIGKKGA